MAKRSGTANIASLLLRRVEAHPSDLVATVARETGVSRQTVHRHLRRLVDAGRIVKAGERRGTRYHLPGAARQQVRLRVASNLEEHRVYEEHIQPALRGLPDNVREISYYGVTEMVNNVLDHAGARWMEVGHVLEKDALLLRIRDDGVGIFEKIADSLDLTDRREAILHLSKGKFTTDPERHTGEGIFFTSRAFDTFILESSGLAFVRFEEDDWLVQQSSVHKGTEVLLRIARDSRRRLKDVFDRFADSATHEFDRTQVVVSLARLGGERFISRSQARRVLLGLERFRRVVLDFRNVVSVGQGFVDEVFRVFRARHPEVDVSYVHANEDVEFMIRRSLGPVQSS